MTYASLAYQSAIGGPLANRDYQWFVSLRNYAWVKWRENVS